MQSASAVRSTPDGTPMPSTPRRSPGEPTTIEGSNVSLDHAICLPKGRAVRERPARPDPRLDSPVDVIGPRDGRELVAHTARSSTSQPVDSARCYGRIDGGSGSRAGNAGEHPWCCRRGPTQPVRPCAPVTDRQQPRCSAIRLPIVCISRHPPADSDTSSSLRHRTQRWCDRSRSRSRSR
jgi:hypothetical protein